MPTVSRFSAPHDLRGWKSALILLLAFLLPLSPLLANVQEDAARQGMVKTGPGYPLNGGYAAHFCALALPLELSLAGRSFAEPYLVLMPLESGTITEDGCGTGRSDGGEKTSGTLWFILGFTTGPWGVLGAYLVNPSTSDVNLKGKTQSFISAYLDCYRDEAKGIHTKWAWIGFGTVLGVVLLVFMVALLGNKPS